MNGTNEVPRPVRTNGLEMTMPVAIVGMACPLPGKVSDLESFWELCLAAKNPWTEIPKDRMSTSAFYHPDLERTGVVRLSPSIQKPLQADLYANQFHIKGAHFLQESIAALDAAFFNITANKAKSIDSHGVRDGRLRQSRPIGLQGDDDLSRSLLCLSRIPGRRRQCLATCGRGRVWGGRRRMEAGWGRGSRSDDYQ